MIITFNNDGKNPNELHDYLTVNNCTPTRVKHNARYLQDGPYRQKIEEATEIYIEIEPEKEALLQQLVAQFMA